MISNDITDPGGVQIQGIGSIILIYFIIEKKVMDPWVVMKSFIIVILFFSKVKRCTILPLPGVNKGKLFFMSDAQFVCYFTRLCIQKNIHCKPIPVMKTGFSLCSISNREKPVFINWEPCNENRFFPVWKY